MTIDYSELDDEALEEAAEADLTNGETCTDAIVAWLQREVRNSDDLFTKYRKAVTDSGLDLALTDSGPAIVISDKAKALRWFLDEMNELLGTSYTDLK